MSAPGIAVNTAATIARPGVKVSEPWQCVKCGTGHRLAYMAPAHPGSKVLARCANCGARARGGRWKGYPLYGTFVIDPRGVIEREA